VVLGGAAAAADPVVTAVGDIACDPGDANFNNGDGTASFCRQKYTAALLAGSDAVLTLGDLQYENGTLAKFNASYDLSWGAYKSVTHPAPGNHEYLTAGASGYFAYFGAAAGDAAKGYYSFDLGNWHLVALNSECANVGGCQAGSAQEQWLAADLASTSKRCIVAYWHKPRFTSGSPGNDLAYDAFWRDLYAARGDLVLVGHDHEYERFALQNPDAVADSLGIREFVVGTGGRSHAGFVTVAANSEVRNGTTFGVLKLTLHAGSYDWQFVPEAGSTFTDSGSTDCHRSATTGVVVAGFSGERVPTGVRLHWRPAALRVAGFNIYRGDRRLNRRLVAGWSWLDRAPPSVASTYRLEAVSLDGRRRSAGTTTVSAVSR
jgi:hypothetical protein